LKVRPSHNRLVDAPDGAPVPAAVGAVRAGASLSFPTETVAITFSATGAQRFGEITEQNVGRHLAIILDGTLYSAPRINERIPGGRAVITGQFTVEQVLGSRAEALFRRRSGDPLSEGIPELVTADI
jgi:hypothetical protein